MHIGILTIDMALPAETLKEKRAIVRSVVARVRERYNAAAVEGGPLDDPGAAVVTVACLSNDPRHLDEQLQTIANAVTEWRLDVEIRGVATEQIAL